MTRTNIELDDDLVHEVMRRYQVTTKRAAVDLALRRMVGPPVDRQFLEDIAGIGWAGDLESLRGAQVDRIG